MAKCTLDFIPTKRRHRMNTRTHKAYTDPQNIAEREAIQWAYITQCGRKRYDGAIALRIDTYARLPKSKTTPEHNTHKPDVDNTAKAIMDALNGIAFTDDTQVVCLHVCKHDRCKRDFDYLTFSIQEITSTL